MLWRPYPKGMTAHIDPFQAIAVSRLAHQLKQQGNSVIHMEFGQPSTGAPAGSIAAAHKVLDADGMGYWESMPLKERIARHYAETYGVMVRPSQILLTCGASPALVLALNCAFGPGARIAMARPGYVAYRNTSRALHLNAVEIPCGMDVRFQLTAKALAALDPAPDGVILASPANPTGAIIPPDELAAIAALAQQRGIRIISDEIYHGLHFGEAAHSMLEFAPDAIIINSFSKYFSMAGWRLGWMVAPDDLVAAATARMGNLFLTPPSLAQHAALAAFDCRDELEGHRAVYRANLELLLDALPKMGLVNSVAPDGAFYLYCDIGHLTDDSMEFCLKLLEETGVATAPGVDFDPADGGRFIRFSFAVSTPLVKDAIARLIPWFQTLNRSA